MLTPLPSMVVYRLFGVDTPLAEAVLTLWAIAVIAAGVWLCWRLARELDAPLLARLAAVSFVSLSPRQFGLETLEGRNWEVNLAVVILAWVLLRLVKSKAAKWDTAKTGAISGGLFMISPPAGMGALAALSLFHIQRVRPRHWWVASVAFLAVVGCLGGFWALRNAEQLGSPIALRDNFGLELDLSNHQGAVNPSDEYATYWARYNQIHPYGTSAAVIDRMRAAGEVGYYKKLGQDARRWIRSHPGQFVEISARHFVEFYFPPKWFWGTYQVTERKITFRQFLEWLVSFCGLTTLALLSVRDARYGYILVAVFACSLPYIMVQPTLRYRYLVSTLLVFAAFDGVTRLTAIAISRKRLFFSNRQRVAEQ